MFPVLSNVNNVNTNIHVQIFMSQRFWFYLHKYLGVGLYGHMIRVCLQETVKLSFEVVVLVSFPPALGIENSLCSLDSGPLSGMWFANVFFFSQLMLCCFILFMISFKEQEFLMLMMTSLSLLNIFWITLLVSYLRTLCQTQVHENVLYFLLEILQV